MPNPNPTEVAAAGAANDDAMKADGADVEVAGVAPVDDPNPLNPGVATGFTVSEVEVENPKEGAGAGIGPFDVASAGFDTLGAANMNPDEAGAGCGTEV